MSGTGRHWNLPGRDVTPESAALSRRRWLKWAGLGTAAISAGAGAWWWWKGTDAEVVTRGSYHGPGADLYPASRNPDFRAADRDLSSETAAARYCNFYEFSSTKQVWRYLEPFQPLPWQLEITGLVAKPTTFDVHRLVR